MSIGAQGQKTEKAVFIRLLADDDKAAALAGVVAALRDANAHPDAYTLDPASFATIPGSPFAYWVDNSVRDLFSTRSSLRQLGLSCYQGLITADDGRFLRLSWEVEGHRVTRPEDTYGRLKWGAFVKGGEFSRFYSSVYMVVDCQDGFSDLVSNANRKYPYLKGGAQKFLHAVPEIFFSPGLTYTRRTTRDFSVRVLSRGCLFSDKGPGIITRPFDSGFLYGLLAILNSRSFAGLLALTLGAATEAARSYETGIVEQVPLPDLSIDRLASLSALAREAHNLRRHGDESNEITLLFQLPALVTQRDARSLTIANNG